LHHGLDRGALGRGFLKEATVHLTTLLEMAAEAFGDRVGCGSRADGLTYGDLLDRARAASGWITAKEVERVGLVDVNSEAVPIMLFGSGLAGVPFVPVNYRLADEQLGVILARTAPSVVVTEEAVLSRVGAIDGVELLTRSQLFRELHDLADTPDGGAELSPDDIAILLFTSGTTGEPKAAVLRHRHLAMYVIGTVDFMGADEDEAALVSVPPYHVAGISAILTGVYAGRRVVHLPAFTAEAWVATARDERVTQAMVVPTMLQRILDVLGREGETLPALRHLSYGGGRMPVPVIERALGLLPQVEFVNAYGLTETTSTISVLGADDHRQALASADPALRARLASVGRPLPTIEIEIRDARGAVVVSGDPGEIWVRGEQVAGEYLGRDDVLEDGWFPTRDSGFMDEAGYLYLEGRLDDVIVRGAENISPGEIEDVLTAHPGVIDACVVGVPDVQWGEMVVAAVVLSLDSTATEPELQAWVRTRLRSSKTPERVVVRTELPYNDTGKLLRRVVKAELSTALAASGPGEPA
jgi:acyl-CoA synthetase (AMP-forming)/AMP-acid ligase II